MSDVVQKLRGFCHTLRHDGIDYGDYIEQITYLLFLKMADERSVELPKAFNRRDRSKPRVRRAGARQAIQRPRGWRGLSMTHAYVNYPRARVATHQRAECSDIQKMGKQGQRRIRLDAGSFSQEIRAFVEQRHDFQSTATANDMWIDIDFGNDDFEQAVLTYILHLLAARYSPFADVTIDHHC